MGIIETAKKGITHNKVLFSYGYSWLSWAGWGLVVANTLYQFWPFNLVPFPLLMFCGFIGIWTTGFLLHKYGMYSIEQSFITENNKALIARLEAAKNDNISQ